MTNKIDKYWIVITFLVFLSSIYFFYFSGYIYFFNDVYVYLSYSESLYNIGYIYDATTIPPTSPITTQNGITLIYSFLRTFTYDMLTRIHVVIFLLTINLVFIYYIIFQIGKTLDIQDNILKIFILSLVFSFYFYGYYVVPTNDGFYISLFLLSIYLILRLIKENNQSYSKYWIYLFFISITVPIFRLQGMIEIIASIMVFALIQRNYQKTFFSFLLLCSAFISVKVIVHFLINDYNGLSKLAENSLIYNFLALPNSINLLLTDTIPSMYLNFRADNLNSIFFTICKSIFSFIVLCVTIFIFIKSFINKNSKIFFLILIIFGNYGALILFNVMVDRYIYINSTLLSLIILYYLRNSYRKYFSVMLLILAILTFSSRLIFKQFPYKQIESNIQYIERNYSDYNLISQNPREFYFYLKKPTITNLEYLNKKSSVILIGDNKFINDKINNFKEQKLKINIRNLPINWQIGKSEILKSYEINILKEEENEN